jgi:hypothetical protein
MNSRTAPASRFRLSIRGLLALTAGVAMAFGAVLYANQWWLTVLTLLVSLGTVASIVVALLDRGPRRAFAIGFFGVYGGQLICASEDVRRRPKDARRFVF